MYVGRFIVAGPGIGAYRVSSRSFPHREIVDRDGVLTVTETEDAPPTDNPYIAYNCVRTPNNQAVLANGSHADPIAEKIARGYPARDALIEALHGLDYEKDDYNTPRIAAVVGPQTAYIGTVRHDALLVREVDEPTIVATYEIAAPQPDSLDATTPQEAALAVYDRSFEHAVCAAGVSVDENGIETAIHNG